MTRPGRLKALRPTTYVLTAHEVALDFFRCGPDYLESEAFKRAYPTFPRPRPDGLYHRGAVETWVDSTFGIAAGSPPGDVKEQIREIARRGAR